MSLEKTPYANSLFEQPWWLDIVAPGQWKEIFVKDEKGKIIARMPYVTDGKKVFMPEKTQNLGIWMAPEVKNNYSAQKKVINEIFSQISEYRSIHHMLSPRNQYILPFRWLGYTFSTSFTYRLENLSDLDDVYRNFSKHAKRHINYAKNKVIVSEKLSIETMWDLLDKTYKIQNRKYPVPKDIVYRIIENCEANGQGKYFEAKDNLGNVHSCAYFIYDEEVCYYSIGAHNPDFASSCSQELILWKGIEFAAQHSKIFDFEGSMVEGIEEFFKKYGGTCTPYYEIRKDKFLQAIFFAAKPYIKRFLRYKI